MSRTDDILAGSRKPIWTWGVGDPCAATPWNYDMSEAPLDTAIVVANTETWGRAFLYTRDRLWLMNGEWFTPDEFAETFIAWAAINLPEGDRG